jgi:hypothetical protein
MTFELPLAPWSCDTSVCAKTHKHTNSAAIGRVQLGARNRIDCALMAAAPTAQCLSVDSRSEEQYSLRTTRHFHFAESSCAVINSNRKSGPCTPTSYLPCNMQLCNMQQLQPCSLCTHVGLVPLRLHAAPRRTEAAEMCALCVRTA